MLVACRLAGLSTLETYYAGVRAPAQFGPTPRSRDKAHVARAEALSASIDRNVRRPELGKLLDSRSRENVTTGYANFGISRRPALGAP